MCGGPPLKPARAPLLLVALMGALVASLVSGCAAERCDRFVVELEEGASPEAFASDVGAALVGRVGTFGNYYEFDPRCPTEQEVGRRGGSASALDIARRDRRSLEVLPQQPQVRVGRGATDGTLSEVPPMETGLLRGNRPLPSVAATRLRRGGSRIESYEPAQWHLSDEGNAATGYVLGAWARGATGAGVTVVVVDDGLDKTHPDLSPGYVRGESANYNGGASDDPTPRGNEAHGTAAASIAAAGGSKSPPGRATCGHGVAFEADVAGRRVISEPATDADEARALTRISKTSLQQTSPHSPAVFSCSWGPTDDGTKLDGPGALATAAITAGAAAGDVYVWAAGNGAGNGDSCAYDGYVQHPDVLAIGAVAFDGTVPRYSEACPALFGSAPSSGSGRSIVAADLSGMRGTTTGDCQFNFGGTSAAAPFYAGVAALVLSTNPALGSRDVARILMHSARRIAPTDQSWVRNAAGVWHSDRYGFGVADAETAVVLAADYRPVPDRCGAVVRPTRATQCGSAGSFPCAIPDGTGQVTACVVVSAAADMRVERVIVSVTASHARRGDLEFSVTSPAGTVATFPRRPRDTASSYVDWKFESLKTWGETASGSWCAAVRDVVSGNRGELVRVSVSIIGVLASCVDE
jgi:kexin